MGTVFGKNTTSSAITVAGHKVYYIDSNDAEIVEVEKQGGGGSTASDDVTGTISGVTLPTAHSYTGATFDSLRYYAKGTLSNTGYVDGTAFGQYGRWFYGTLTWEDATLGDLTLKITTNSASSSVLLKQQYFRIIFIYDGAISGVHPSDTSESTGNQITEYSYNDGVHSIRFYAQSSNWYNGQSSGRIQFRYLDGTTTFNNLSAFDLVNVSGGSLSKATITDRYDMYNAWGGNITLHALYGSGASDDATGTISGVTLPTAHSYTGVSFDSLRYYAKGTLSNTGYVDGTAFGQYGRWFYGTLTWEDATLGDLTLKITTNSASSSVLLKQQYFRIIFIYYGAISGVHPSDTSESTGNQITEYSYNDGVHSIRFYAQSSNWYNGQSSGRIQFRYLDDVTTFNNLSAFDLVNVSGGSLSKATTTDRYDMYNAWNGDITLHALYGSAETIRRNAFKYLLSGTPYWYVIDGEHDTWTDDLSAWGYNEVRPVVELPTVTPDNWVLPDTSSGVTIIQGGSTSAAGKAGAEPREKVAFDNSCVYATTFWRHADNTFAGRVEIAPVNNSGYIGLHNTTNQALEVYWVNYAACSDSTATVVTVYDSSNNAYNAFKYTLNGTDYYYVLDGTQTDWTDDLGSIGYRGYQEIVLYMPGGSGYESQYGVTSGYTGDPNSRYLYPLYSDPECTIPASYDATKRYEAGYYHYQTGEWTVKPIQTVTDMPSSTVSQFSDKTTAEILHNDNGVAKLWAINNYVSSYPSYAFSYGSNPVSFRFRLKTILAV